MTHDWDSKPYTYGVIREEYLRPDGRRDRVAYGVAAYAHARETGTATVVASVHDMTARREAALALVDRCNRCGLSPCHLSEVAEELA